MSPVHAPHAWEIPTVHINSVNAPRDRIGAGAGNGQVHPGPRRLVISGPQGPRRTRLHPRVDRGPVATPAHEPRPCRCGLARRCKSGALTTDEVVLESRKAADFDLPDTILAEKRETRDRYRALTEQTADAAIDQACRILRLPTIRTQFLELDAAAACDQMSYRTFLAELFVAERVGRQALVQPDPTAAADTA
jgi:hypothetical protein